MYRDDLFGFCDVKLERNLRKYKQVRGVRMPFYGAIQDTQRFTNFWGRRFWEHFQSHEELGSSCHQLSAQTVARIHDHGSEIDEVCSVEGVGKQRETPV